MSDEFLEIALRYFRLLYAAGPRIALLLVAGTGLGLALRARAGHPPTATARRLPRYVAAGGAVAGLLLAWGQRSLVDDAFISFRYAKNLLDGHGLVWNIGERVEGYTNFLWTILLAGLARAFGIELPLLGLFLPLACFVANILVIARIGRALAGDSSPYVPWAAALFAVSYVATQFATTGMETMAASLLVDGALYFLIARTDARGAAQCAARNAALAGSLLILATLTRPDHALFYAVGGLVVLAEAVRATARAVPEEKAAARRMGARALLAYAAPLVPYAGYLAWKLSYYGAILPNTYYAKSAGASYWGQGAVYAATFYVGTHFWVVAALFALGVLARGPEARQRRFALFAGGAFVVWNAYVLRVGGDFMYGRFYVTLMPLLLLGAEVAVARLLVRRSRLAGPVALGLLLATAHGLSPIPARAIRCGIADEATYYPVESVRPLRVGSAGFRDGHALAALLTDRGITPTIGTATIGMIGYYSRLPVVDLYGLTDPTVARDPVAVRGRPGHEKRARVDHLWRAGVRLISFPYHPGPYDDLARFDLGDGGMPWYVFRYDRDLMRRIRAASPGIGFVDFDRYLDDYLARLPDKDPAAVRADLEYFRAYYFATNPDPERERRIEETATRASATRPSAAAPPPFPVKSPGADSDPSR